MLERRALRWGIAGLGIAYVALTSAMAARWLDAPDMAVHAWVIQNVGPDLAGIPYHALTAVGSAAASIAAVFVAAFLAWRAGAAKTAVVMLAFAAFGAGLVDGFKDLHGRPYPSGGQFLVAVEDEGMACPEGGRCDVALGQNATVYCPPGSRCNFYVLNGTERDRLDPAFEPTDLSGFPERAGRAYPSGHTMGATLSWGLAILLGSRALRGGRSLEPWAVGTWAAVALVGGLTRLPVHAHWLSDVVGSWILGTMLLAGALLVDDMWTPRTDPPRPPSRLRL